MYQWKNDALTNAQHFIAGMECEIESVKALKQNLPEWESTQDGSLRNHGIEFISLPLPRDLLLNGFKNLHASLEFVKPHEAFSHRTSIHVHVNCRPFTTDQLKNFLLLYALFEDFFFSMVSPDRKHNIHCVPLSQTYLSSRYAQKVDRLIGNWHKYTAFNMLPMKALGTVEFRHMHGTADTVLVGQWLRTIENLWTLSQNQMITRENIVSSDQIERWFDLIFSDAPQILRLKPLLPSMIESTLIDVKFALV